MATKAQEKTKKEQEWLVAVKAHLNLTFFRLIKNSELFCYQQKSLKKMKLTLSLKTRFWDFVIKIDYIFILLFGSVLNIQTYQSLFTQSHTLHVHYVFYCKRITVGRGSLGWWLPVLIRHVTTEDLMKDRDLSYIRHGRCIISEISVLL